MALEDLRTLAQGVEEVASDVTLASRAREVAEGIRDQMRYGTRPLFLLGPFMFSAGTASPSRTTRRDRYRWPQQEVVGARPWVQYTGPGEGRLEIEGTIYPHYRGGLRQVQLMRSLAGLGKSQLLVDSLGVVYGMHAIEEVEETGAAYDPAGAPRRIDFRLSLVRAVPEEEAG